MWSLPLRILSDFEFRAKTTNGTTLLQAFKISFKHQNLQMSDDCWFKQIVAFQTVNWTLSHSIDNCQMPHHHLITNSPLQCKISLYNFQYSPISKKQGHSGSPRSWSLLSPVLKIGVGRSGRSQGSPGQDHVRGRGATTTLAKLFNLIYQYTWGGSYPLLPPQGEGGGSFFLSVENIIQPVCSWGTSCMCLGASVVKFWLPLRGRRGESSTAQAWRWQIFNSTWCHVSFLTGNGEYGNGEGLPTLASRYTGFQTSLAIGFQLSKISSKLSNCYN